MVARAAGASGALTIAVATMPGGYLGHQRRQVAGVGYRGLRAYADAVVVLEQERLVRLAVSGRPAWGQLTTSGRGEMSWGLRRESEPDPDWPTLAQLKAVSDAVLYRAAEAI